MHGPPMVGSWLGTRQTRVHEVPLTAAGVWSIGSGPARLVSARLERRTVTIATIKMENWEG